MVAWVNAHGIAVLVGYYIFCAISGGMPSPKPTAGVAYQWMFNSLGILNASLARLVATQLPNSTIGKTLTGGNNAPLA